MFDVVRFSRDGTQMSLLYVSCIKNTHTKLFSCVLDDYGMVQLQLLEYSKKTAESIHGVLLLREKCPHVFCPIYTIVSKEKQAIPPEFAELDSPRFLSQYIALVYQPHIFTLDDYISAKLRLGTTFDVGMFFRNMLRFVAEIHGAGVYHGSIGPAAFVTDFSNVTHIAKVENSRSLSSIGKTSHPDYAYASPEEHLDIACTCARDKIARDVYSLGMTFFSMLTGGNTVLFQEGIHRTSTATTFFRNLEASEKCRLIISENISNHPHKSLIESMLSINPAERPSIDECFAHISRIL